MSLPATDHLHRQHHWNCSVSNLWHLVKTPIAVSPHGSKCPKRESTPSLRDGRPRLALLTRVQFPAYVMGRYALGGNGLESGTSRDAERWRKVATRVCIISMVFCMS
jgi:hypothetical protein